MKEEDKSYNNSYKQYEVKANLTPEQKAQKTLNKWTEKVNKKIEDSNANVGKLDPIDDLNPYQTISDLTDNLNKARQNLSYCKSETNRLLKAVQDKQGTIGALENTNIATNKRYYKLFLASENANMKLKAELKRANSVSTKRLMDLHNLIPNHKKTLSDKNDKIEELYKELEHLESFNDNQSDTIEAQYEQIDSLRFLIKSRNEDCEEFRKTINILKRKAK